ncbi:polysaccharide biosynthesis tyrosine autokinase [Nodosilinea sp. E11]|uniref:GumC family protein n=1 Tax=Nodosilinea sp. E11 TaxID=3037479 RepID=UPI0029350624|nr:polysaccharide biosynthesis tyrosine autokinase [Nodosilinea sp. E11]WOD39272.1 polysaccharide biosynthesis tyrosine autokinase [Nodosilinea sp. E11]
MVSTSATPPHQDTEFGYGQLFATLLRRWPWIAGTLAIAMAGAVYVSLQERPIYRSTMQLIVEPNFDQDLKLQDFAGVADGRANQIDYATQLNLMRSSQFIDDAVALLQEEYPDLTSEQVENQFFLFQVEEGDDSTRIFQATYTDEDPLRTQRVLAALESVYLQYNQEQQANRLTRGLEHINNQLANTQANLAQSQADLEQFRQSQNILDPYLQGQAAVESLGRVLDEQRKLAADLNQMERKYATLESRLALSPQAALVASRLSQSGRIQTLLNTLQETSLALADRQILFTDQDPTVQVLASQRENQLAQLRQEISTVVRQPGANLDATMQSYLQLGQVDLSLVSELIEADISLQELTARLNALAETENLLRQEIDRFPGLIAQYDRLQPSVEINRTTFEQLLTQREQLSSELARGGFLWQIIEPPRAGKRIGPDPVRPIALGLVLGLFAGGALAFAIDSMDKRVRTSEELRKQVPLPLLGILPLQTIRRGRVMPTLRREDGGVIMHPELADSALMQTVMGPQFRDSLDLIANNLQILPGAQVPKAVAVTSGLAGEGKTTLTLGLAFSLARMNQRVLVIDADLRRSGIQAELGLTMETGLATLLAGRQKKGQPHRLDFGMAHVDVLPAGPAPTDPIALLSSPRFSSLIAQCKTRYDVVLVDTPPVLGMADSLKVGAVCDSTVLVTRLDRITQPELTEVLDLLAPINVLGIIANGAKGASTTRYSNQAYGAITLEA